MQDLTSGSLTRHLIKTSSFMLVAMVFQTLYVLVDLYWVGRLGTEAVAAVAISGNLMFFVLGATQMLGVGTTTLVAHATGRKDHAQAVLIFNQAQLLSLIVGVLFFFAVMAVRTTYATRMSADADTARLIAEYLRWFIPGMALQFGLIAMGAALRGTGTFKPGMVVQTATVIINIVLAPVLIFGWGTGRPFGVAGAAMATLVAIAIGIVWMAAYFLPPTAYLRFVRRDWRPRPALWGDMLKIGLPAGAEFALMATYLVIIYGVSRRFGATAQAGFGIGMRILQACFMPAVALGFAVGPVAGQNVGARQADRVRSTFTTAAIIAASSMLVVAIAAQVASRAAVGFFSSDPRVIDVAAEYMRIVSWSFIASGVIFVSSSMFQAMGNTIPALVTSIIRLVLVSTPLIWLTQLPGFSLRWVWYLSVATVGVHLLMNLLFLRREYRLRLRFDPAPSA